MLALMRIFIKRTGTSSQVAASHMIHLANNCGRG
jgi:hypothetical protein